jgi:hypothetical protein
MISGYLWKSFTTDVIASAEYTTLRSILCFVPSSLSVISNDIQKHDDFRLAPIN